MASSDKERPSVALLGFKVGKGPGDARPGASRPGDDKPGRDMTDDLAEEDDESDSEREQEEQDAAQMVIDALEQKDPKSLVDAYRALKTACGGD